MDHGIFARALFGVTALLMFVTVGWLDQARTVAQSAAAVDQAALFDNLPVRNIGPANMGGRIVDLAVVDSNPQIMYVAAASGGLWKTTDGGDSWVPVFDGQRTLNLGCVAVAPSDPKVVWVGSGEANPRNSVSWGHGVYRSGDGGKTWVHTGLADAQHIGRIVVHPTNPDIAYVAALGHLWGPNKERGLYQTVDGGKSWRQSHFIDENTGFIDVAIDPAEPSILYAAAYQVRRDGFAGGNPRAQTGPGAGLYKTSDGGQTWHKMVGGLPERPYGRCGLAIYRQDPRIVYAVVQTDKTAVTTAGQIGDKLLAPEAGGVFRSDDKGKTWTHLSSLVPRPFYYGQIRIDPSDDQRIYVLGVSFFVSADGGKSFKGAKGTHPDHHALWINPKNSKHLVLGNDGGLYFSTNQGKAWDAVRGMALGQFYAVAVDMRTPYRVYGGLQDNGTWGGPTATDRAEGITLADWKNVIGADGFQCQVDPTNPDIVYCESQYGGLRRVDLQAPKAKVVKGKAAPGSIKPKAPKGEPAFRFNWNSPLLLSTHDSKTLYYGGNHLFKSVNRGDKWDVISPDLTRGQPGPSAVSGHTLTTIAEAPLKAGLIYVGSDDGRLHVARDDGKTWIELELPGLPSDRWITRIECSQFAEGTAYVTVDRHRQDDRRPYIFKTTDHGANWTSLTSNLPTDGVVHVIRESSRNRDLLFAGTEFGLFVSLDGGGRWHHVKKGLPAGVTVHDLVIHPRERELVIGTHGRSIYVMDIAPLEALTPQVLGSAGHLFDIRPAVPATLRQEAGAAPSKAYRAANPPQGAVIHYYLKETAPGSLRIADGSGKTIAQLPLASKAGLHHAVWNLRTAADSAKIVEAGEYMAKLRIGAREWSRKLRVEGAKGAAQD